MNHKAGFVNIIGNPNVGKSTLLNALLDDKLSIISSKPQTTRHRILGIYNDDDHQIVFSDSPGIIENPAYGMQSAMNTFAYTSLEDADILLFMTDPFDKYTGEEAIIQQLTKKSYPAYLLINKIDLKTEKELKDLVKHWELLFPFDEVFLISAKEGFGIENLLQRIKDSLPEHPPYYPKDQLSDKNIRFFISEIIREKIMDLYKQEIPYSCEVVVDEFLEKEEKQLNITHIYISIYVERESQKPIIIGRKGSAIKKLGIESRKDIERFLDESVFLELKVKVKDNWRDDDRLLKHFGYKQ